MYGTNAVLPRSAEDEHPVDGANPPRVFTRWMKVVPVSVTFPSGPSALFSTVSSSHAMEFGATKAGSLEAWSFSTNAQTELVSRECCHAVGAQT